MLPADLSARAILGDCISISEFSTFGDCEWRWDFSYNQDTKRDSLSQSLALSRGTELHRLVQHWWQTKEVLTSEDAMAQWLIERYALRYKDQPDYSIQIEMPFVAELPFGPKLFGYMDGVFTDRFGKTWILEVKSMGQWDKLAQLPRDMQVSAYIWALKQTGLDVAGVYFDAIRTYMPKRDPESVLLDDSFDRRIVTRTDEELQDMLDQLESMYGKRQDLQLGRRKPIRNLGQSCTRFCPAVAACYGLDFQILED